MKVVAAGQFSVPPREGSGMVGFMEPGTCRFQGWTKASASHSIGRCMSIRILWLLCSPAEGLGTTSSLAFSPPTSAQLARSGGYSFSLASAAPTQIIPGSLIPSVTKIVEPLVGAARRAAERSDKLPASSLNFVQCFSAANWCPSNPGPLGPSAAASAIMLLLRE